MSDPSHGMPEVPRHVHRLEEVHGRDRGRVDRQRDRHAGIEHPQQGSARVPGVAEAQLGVDRVAERGAGTRHRLAVGLGRREEVGDEEVRAEVAALLQDRGADLGRAALDRVDGDRQAAVERVAHLDVEHRHLAEIRTSKVDAEVDEPLERRARTEPLVADAVDVGEVQGLVDGEHVAVAVRVARAHEAVAMSPQLGVSMGRACACCGPSRGRS